MTKVRNLDIVNLTTLYGEQARSFVHLQRMGYTLSFLADMVEGRDRVTIKLIKINGRDKDRVWDIDQVPEAFGLKGRVTS